MSKIINNTEVVELNDKQKRFCLEYLKDFNGTQAAIRAGYSKNTANEQASALLAKLNVQNYIGKLNEKVEKKAIMDIQEIQERLTMMARGEILEETVAVEGQGQGYSQARIVSKKVSPKEQAKALELLGKANGLFVEKIQAEVNDGLLVAKQYLEGAKDGKFTKV